MEREQSASGPVAITLRNGVQVTIRPFAREDGPALADFYEAIPPEDRHWYAPHPLTREKAMALAAGAGGPGSRLVCVVLETADKQIAGEAWFRWKKADSARSTFGICIRPDLQGAGAGRALMQRLLDIGAESGPPLMSLTVQKSNPRAVALYTKMGFEIVREQVRSDGEPEYYMERRMRGAGQA